MRKFTIAGIALFVDSDLEEYLPDRMSAFEDDTALYLIGKPPLRVCIAEGLFCDINKTDSDERILQQSWHGRLFEATFSPSTGMLLISKESMRQERSGIQFCLMQFIRVFISQMLLRYGGFVLHASAVNTNRQALLFSGYSGIGKSTQARLWSMHDQASIINHDSPMIICCDGMFYACGNPWSGSDACYKQECVLVKCLVLLDKGMENRVYSASEREVVRFMLSQSLTSLLVASDVDLLISNIQTFVSNTSVIRYSCKPDFSAIDTLKEYLIKEKILTC